MKTQYETRITQLTVAPPKAPIFAETATTITLEDEAAGEYVIVQQDNGAAVGKIAINPDEWPVLRDAIERMVNECRKDEDGS
jgi:uncharacterized protein